MQPNTDEHGKAYGLHLNKRFEDDELEVPCNLEYVKNARHYYTTFKEQDLRALKEIEI